MIPLGFDRGGTLAAAGLTLLLVLTIVGPVRPALNLVVVTLDTTRADRIGAYGGSRAAATPALDRLAREGVLFEDATAPAPLTLPAHCTLFTGRLPPAHRVHDNAGRFDATTPTLASVLLERHYTTGAFVGSLVLARSRGLSRGFQVYDDRIPWSKTARRHPRRKADAVVDRALGWIDGVKASPFFAWLHFYDAHAPYEAAAPFDRSYRGRPYEAAIASVDAQIGRLRGYLDRNDLTNRTVIVVIGDHGEGLGDHGELTHGLFLYQSVLHVPFIIRAPGAPRRQRVRTAVSSADLTPTLLDLLGAAPLENLDGRSLAPLFRRHGRDVAADIYAENLYLQRRFKWSALRVIRAGSLKYIDKTGPELYDLERDPGETHDLSTERPAVTARLARRLRAWQERSEAEAGPSSGPVTEDVRARLMSLGYVADSTVIDRDEGRSSGSDPREHVALFNCLSGSAGVREPPLARSFEWLLRNCAK